MCTAPALRPSIRLAAVVLIGVAAASWPSPARADDHIVHIRGTGVDGLWLHAGGPTLASDLSLVMAEGTAFAAQCWAIGDDVLGDRIWLYGTDMASGSVGFATDAYLDTDLHVNVDVPSDLVDSGVPNCDDPARVEAAGGSTIVAQPTAPQVVSYDRRAAVEWATANLNTPPSFGEGDCTWYASQVLWAGGIQPTSDWNGSNFALNNQASLKHWPGPTRTATVTDEFVQYLEDSGIATLTPITWSDNTADGAQPGDLIAYDWNNGADGTYDHVAVVTDFTDSGFPLVSQHSPSRERYWSWDPTHDGWIQSTYARSDGLEPQAVLLHING